MATEQVRRQAFGAFLRSRRERLAPGSVGLPDGFPRRTPGLRREEVALLAGVGTIWYTWLDKMLHVLATDGKLWRAALAIATAKLSIPLLRSFTRSTPRPSMPWIRRQTLVRNGRHA